MSFGYIKRNPDVFLNLEKSMKVDRPSFQENGGLAGKYERIYTDKITLLDEKNPLEAI